MKRLVVYGSFNCPYCYFASAIVDGLIASGTHVEWRAVVNDPQPKEGRLVVGPLANRLDRQIANVTVLSRGALEIYRPTVYPDTSSAVATFSTARGADADRLRRALFHAYWVDGKDIGDTFVLRSIAGHVGLSSLRMRTWQQQWSKFAEPVVPIAVDEDGIALSGVDALASLVEHEAAHTEVC